MKQHLIELFNSYPQYAFLFSISINIVVAVLGVVPSVFVTAANILFFGFWPGTLISFLGEAIGALIAFLLYRYVSRKKLDLNFEKYPSVKKLLYAGDKDAFLAIISLRLLPFIPSGLITFAAAIGSVGIPAFFIASSLGKIPALLIEAYAAYQVTSFSWQGKLLLVVFSVYLLCLVYKRWKAR